MPRPVASTGTYRPGLDGIRALAVAGVLAYHFDAPWLPGGLLGVGVFFTLSGYLITGILLHTWDQRGNLDLTRFWVRRARRLIPALALVITAVVIATALIAPLDLGDRLRETLAASLYVSNWTEIASGQSYFDQFAGPGPLDHLWSLAVEEQFYLIWPLVLLVLLHLKRGQLARIGAMTVGLAAASFVLLWIVAQPGLDNTRAYEGTDTRAGAMLAGAALAVFLHAHRTAAKASGRRSLMERAAPRWLDVLGGLGVAAIVMLAITVDDYSMSLYSTGMLALTLATVAVVLAAAHPHSRTGIALGIWPLRWLGERSYGVYLWHMPIVASMPSGFLADQPWVRGAFGITLTLVVASASWVLVEDPIRRHGLRATLNFAWFATMVATAARAIRRTGTKPQPSRSTTPAALSLGTRPRLHVLAGSAVVVLLGVSLATGSAAVTGSDAEAAKATSTTTVTSPPPTESDASAAPVPPASAAPTPPANARTSDAPDLQEPAPSAVPEPEATSCSAVVHVGDSTSLGLVEKAALPKANDRIEAQYKRVGVEQVDLDILGARSIVEKFEGEPNAQEAVKQRTSKGYAGCWVIAMGTNEVANQAVGGAYPLDERIDLLMKDIGDQQVLWLTVKTQKSSGPWADKGMKEMNSALVNACERYPNLRVYDWRAEVKDSWYLSDGIHFTSDGYRERGHRIADALIQAFPRDAEPHVGCVVTSG